MNPARLSLVLVLSLCLAGTGCAASSSAGESTTPAVAPAPAEPAAAEPAPAADASGWFTEAQAERGQATFRGICSECHYASEFRGSQFAFEWKRRTVRDLFRTIARTMPEDAPGSLKPEQYADVVSYILSLNGLPTGAVELPADPEALRAYSLADLGQRGS